MSLALPSQQFWDAVLRAIPEAITVINGRGEFLYANDLAAHMCGFDSAADMIAAGNQEVMSRFEILEADGHPASIGDLPGRKIIRRSETFERAIVRYRDLHSGEERWSELHSSALALPDSGETAAVNVFQDVTEDVRGRRALTFLVEAGDLLSQSLDLDTALASLARLAVPGICDWCSIDLLRDDGSVENVAVTHVDPDKVALARDLQQKFPFDASAETGLAQVLRTGRPELISTIPDEMLVAAILDRDLLEVIRELGLSSSMCVPLKVRERVLGAMTFVAAESGRHFNEQDLAHAGDLARRAALAVDNAFLYRASQRAMAEQRAILVQIADGIMVADGAGIVIFANEAAHRLFGGVEIGVPVQGSRPNARFATLEGDELGHDEMMLNRAIQGETVTNFLLRVSRNGEDDVILQTSAGPLIGDDGKQLGAVTVSRDVTLEHEFDRHKDEFLVAASHDLKNPLTLIKGTAQLLEQRAIRLGEALDGSFVEGLRNVSVAATRMAEMVNEMLDVTRVEMGRPLSLDIQPADLCALLERVVGATIAGGDRNPLTYDRPAEPLMAEVDSCRIERVAHNLVINAVKFSDANSPITISLEREGEDWAVISVKDWGMGIPAAEVPTIFEHFKRGTNVEQRVGGSGIGLAGVKRIVQEHGGSVSATSEVDKGSTFTVRLPLRQKQHTEEV